MDDHDALRINSVKGQIEQIMADLQISQPGAGMAHSQAWAFVVFKLAEAQQALAEAVEKAGEHSLGPIEGSKNTANEVAKALAYLLQGGNPDQPLVLVNNDHPEALFN